MDCLIPLELSHSIPQRRLSEAGTMHVRPWVQAEGEEEGVLNKLADGCIIVPDAAAVVRVAPRAVPAAAVQ